MKKRIGSVLLALALCLSLLPATALAAGGTTNNAAEVSTKADLNAALSDASVAEIHIIADMNYNDSLVASKTVQVNAGVTLTLDKYETTVSGTIINNGTIQVNSKKCFWTATTTGTGKLIGGTDPWGDPSTYVDYGCVPETMLDGCRINIVKDISQPVTATLPDTMQTGDTISVTFSNLIEGVDPSKVFNFVWKDGSSSKIYGEQATPTLTQSGTLKLSLSMKTPYVMCTSSGTNGSLDAQGTVTQKLLDTIYVDQTNGNNSNLGDTAAQPVKSIDKALDKVTDGGKIVLLSNYRGRIVFDKSVTVKSKDGNDFALTSSSSNYVSDGVTVTFENLKFTESTQFSRYSSTALGTGSLVFMNCTGSLSISSGDISNITMESSQLSGTIFASNLLTMKESTFSGKFNTKNFTANGDCTISCKKNAPSYISGTVTAAAQVKLVPFENAKAGDKLLEVPDSTAATSFALSDTSGAYGVVFSEQYNGNYLCLAQRINAADIKIAVGYEPKNKLVPNNSAYVGSTGTGITTCDATWSKDTAWSVGDVPKLTVTLKANDGYIFDNNFNVSDLLVYSWTNTTTYPSYEDAARNTSVTCSTEQGQGVGEDGKTYTFTVQYPTIERSAQTISVNTTDRTANCGDTLNPRPVSAQGTIRYESSDTTVATVDANGGVKALKAGETTITIQAAETEDYQAAATSYKLIVSHKYAGEWKKEGNRYYKECACGDKSYATATPVLGVTLDKQTMSLTVGSTGTLTATITPTDAANQSLTWTSDKEAVATVDENGKVTAVAEGTAKITVKTVDGEKTAVCTVTVTAKTSGGSSSGGSSTPTYPVTKPSKTENGSVTVSPTSAKRGSVVTITVTPDAGYVLDKLTVTDKDGKELSLTKKSDTEYTFVMPAGKVEITPSFVKQTPSQTFVDVRTGDYFYDAVQWAVGKGITNGTSAETFSPEAPCTRAQIVTFLWRAAGSPVVNYAMDLSDVAGDAYYAEAVRWALSEGITTGTSADQFSPNATCTREQAVTFLYRAAGSPAVSGESAFEDVGADAYYARAVAWAAQNGVTNGISQALFGTGSDCTRAQIVTFLYRAQQGK